MTLVGGKIPVERATWLREHYRAALFDDVVPWWMNHSLDAEYGGYYSLLGRDGRPWATDKYMWMNGRQVWLLSHLYNAHEPKAEWREAARLGADFLLRHAFKPDGKMHFRLTREGQSRSEVLSLYTEVFGAIAMAEYSKAAGDESCWAKAMAMYERLMARLGQPTDTPLLGYPIDAKFHLHAHDMCRITVAWVFQQIRPERRFEDALTVSVDSILGRHWKPDLRALLENVAPDGSPLLDLPEGRMFHPGHAIESAWMLLEIARWRGDESLRDTAIEIVLASLDHGWDRQYGGLRYITNIDFTPTHSLEGDMKLWWPHGETLYALLLAWDLSGRDDLARWYGEVHEYTFDHFPDPDYGEWFGYLNRDGSPVWTAKANGWKGCFHLPRILFRALQLVAPARPATG
ncbi:MAG: AGE family epimerase/isomerase [Planctomycetia bacterium]|nr:MAG: AGE family epimerase/isomerase [Planctomycetia bacterium]